MSAHTREQQYCQVHHRWFNACCWECEEYNAVLDELNETPDEREQQRVETYREAQRDEERIERI